MQLLRSLSQTCSRLRAFALPQMWRVVHIDTMAELGRTLETLRTVPGLASHIRTFLMRWELPDWYQCEVTFEKYTRLTPALQLAFSDRSELYARDLAESRCEERREVVRISYSPHKFRGQASYLEGDYTFVDPGQPPLIAERDPSQTSGYDWEARRLGSDGPDGQGEDEYIKDADDFEAAVNEIVTQFTELECFSWQSRLTTVPVRAFAALEKLTALTQLHMNLCTFQSGDGAEREFSCLLLYLRAS